MGCWTIVCSAKRSFISGVIILCSKYPPTKIVMWERRNVAHIVFIIIKFFEELPQGIKKCNNHHVYFSGC